MMDEGECKKTEAAFVRLIASLMLAPIWNCARNASTTSPACLQRVRSGECNSHFVARSERDSGPSAH